MIDEKKTFSLLGSEIEYTIEEIDIANLKYFPGNPRVYTALRQVSDEDPNQDQIEKVMFEEEHVRDLKKRIKTAGGLVDEILVRRDTMEVVEGNSRLAAHRMLAKHEIEWNKIRCRVVETLSDKQTRSLLSEYHIHGKTDWTTYEQANMFYVDHIKKGISIEELHADTGLSKQEIRKKFEIIKMMEENQDNQLKHYSHYEQLLTKQSIKGAWEANSHFRGRVLEDIKQNSVVTAQDVRDKLSVVCENRKSPAFKKYVSGDLDLEDAYEIALNSGTGDESIKKLTKFRNWVTEPSVQANLINQRDTGKVNFEMDKIQNTLKKMRNEIDKREKST